jgi:hypothetical protein
MLVGIVTLNVVMGGAMFVHLRNEDECDIEERGLVVWLADREQWVTISLPQDGNEGPPCRARTGTHLVMLPG